MTLFELVKQNICVPDVAKHYGLQVNRNGMCMFVRSMRHTPQHEAERTVFFTASAAEPPAM